MQNIVDIVAKCEEMNVSPIPTTTPAAASVQSGERRETCSAHSPLPWMLNYVIDGAFEIIANGTPYTKVICSRAKWTTNKSESEANAAYIVQACNSYPKLVEAVKAMIPYCHTILCNYNDSADSPLATVVSDAIGTLRSAGVSL